MRRYFSLYTTIGLIGLAAVLIGFSKTFIFPFVAGTFNAPTVIYVHGGFTFCWIIVFLVQALLIKAENWSLHFKLGLLGLCAALGTALTMPLVGRYQVERELAQGLGETAISSILGTVFAAVVFLAFVAAGLLYGGLFVIADHVIETFAFNSGPWRSAAQFVWAILGQSPNS